MFLCPLAVWFDWMDIHWNKTDALQAFVRSWLRIYCTGTFVSTFCKVFIHKEHSQRYQVVCILYSLFFYARWYDFLVAHTYITLSKSFMDYYVCNFTHIYKFDILHTVWHNQCTVSNNNALAVKRYYESTIKSTADVGLMYNHNDSGICICPWVFTRYRDHVKWSV